MNVLAQVSARASIKTTPSSLQLTDDDVSPTIMPTKGCDDNEGIPQTLKKSDKSNRSRRRMGSLKAVAVITGVDNSVKGSLHFVQEANAGVTQVRGKITGLKPGLHGFHIHAFGDTTNGCNSTGPHFNPLNKDHGAPWDDARHAGDLGNIVAGQDGSCSIALKLSHFGSIRQRPFDIFILLIPLSGQYSILGRAVVIHADSDDLGRGNHELSKTTGNAGARVGCGVIGLQSSV
ncbi:hypothetical protein E3N88_01372 [Mikania micrantha]|uniref:Superoxide dismutase [Cu-Zn] n=1 Tax=Mikania micrantha TaxID=192012 RepID=A0A5N6Q2E3_9ASTR|nr:hypothetical protein E3N88_01372 [Mikania micrantha]